MVQRSEDIQADFLSGEYRKKFYTSKIPEERLPIPIFGVEAFQPEDQFQPELVTKDTLTVSSCRPEPVTNAPWQET